MTHPKRWLRRFGASLLFGLLFPSAFATTSLSAYNVNISDTSVSGLSSGAFMAVQMEVAYSSVFKGAGVIAGGPYDCAAQNNYTGCMYSASPSVSGLISATKSRSGSSIDNISNLAAHKIFMFSGTSDTTVGQGVMNALQSYYTTSPALVPSGNIKYVNNVNAVHTFPTDFDSTGNNACNNSTSPYISNCGYDAAGALLQQIYGPLNARNNGTLGGQYIQFDQSQFIANPNTYGMDTTGWLYVPAACASGSQCKLHVAFHGCLQYQGSIGQKFVQNTGYTKWADTNNIIVLFPQTVADSTTHTTADSGSLSNANGCWDWVGWYGSNFDTRQGVQISAVKAMIDKITSGYSALAAPTGLSVTGSTNSSISLSWSAVSGASGYNVQRNGSQVNSGTITSTAYTDSGLTSGTAYSYTVTAVNSSGGQSARSATVNGTTTGTPPAVPVPTGLSVSAVTASTATLSWSAASGVSGYNVYRATTSGGPYSKLNSALVTATSYGDSGLAASTTYYWGVTAVNSGGTEGAMSSAVSATTSAAAVCYTDNNYNQVAAGRAYQSGGYAYANGSNQNMGLWNLYVTTTLKQTGTNYYVIGTCP